MQVITEWAFGCAAILAHRVVPAFVIGILLHHADLAVKDRRAYAVGCFDVFHSVQQVIM